MPMTGKRRKITAAVVVFFVLFSALFLSVRPENSGYAAGSPATSCTWQSERFSVTEHVNVEELSGVRTLMLRLFPGMRRHAEEREIRHGDSYAGTFVRALFSPEASFCLHDRRSRQRPAFP